MAQKANVGPDMATYLFNSMIYKYFITNYLSELFPVNDCENAPNERQKYVVLVFLTKCFILTPSGHPQSMVNLATVITCDWPPSHY